MSTQSISHTERVLYKYNNGEALVTTRRLVLGKESWLISAIRDVSLSPHEVARGRYYLSTATRKSILEYWKLSRTFSIGVSLFIAAGFLGVLFPSTSPWDVLYVVIGFIGFVLAVMGVALLYTAPMKNPVERYNLRLTLANIEGSEEFYETNYSFTWQTPALKTLAAIQTAVAQNSSLPVDTP